MKIHALSLAVLTGLASAIDDNLRLGRGPPADERFLDAEPVDLEDLSGDISLSMAAAFVEDSKASKSSKSSTKSSKTSTELLDAVVVGSGLAGLIAARDMEAAGLEVQVLEAQDYIGGRMVRKELSPIQSIDLGGQWVGRTHYLLKNLTDELGLTMFKAPELTNGLKYVVNGETMTSDELFTTSVNLEYGACFLAFKYVIDLIPPDTYPFEEVISGNETLFDFSFLNPPRNYTLRELDGITVGQYMDAIPGLDSDLGRFVCTETSPGNTRISAAYPGEPETVSLLAWAFTNRNANTLPKVGDDAEELLIQGAAGQIPPLLAGELSRPVRLSDPVTRISQMMMGGKIQATVYTQAGKKYTAKNVVVATSPYISGHISYYPPLSWKRHQLNQHKPMGTVAKVLLQYERKFWEGSGSIITAKGDGMLSMCTDVSDNRITVEAVYCCLITGEQYDHFAESGETNDERINAVLQELSQVLGDKALSPLSVDVGNWPAAPYIQGSYSSYWPTQAWTRFGSALLRPEGVIQWCSTEYALKWHGYFEGALESGMRAAANVIEGKIGELKELEHPIFNVN